jgi:hypothetical protein
MGAGTTSERVEELLAALLGPNMARNATRTFCRQSLGIEPEALTPADVPRLAAALRPALRTLLGATSAERVVEEIVREFR